MSNAVHAEIATEAYFLWLQDGGMHGRADQHWEAAEKMVAKRQVTAGKVTGGKGTARKVTARKPRKREGPVAAE